MPLHALSEPKHTMSEHDEETYFPSHRPATHQCPEKGAPHFSQIYRCLNFSGHSFFRVISFFLSKINNQQLSFRDQINLRRHSSSRLFSFLVVLLRTEAPLWQYKFTIASITAIVPLLGILEGDLATVLEPERLATQVIKRGARPFCQLCNNQHAASWTL